ncbi:hypothetical protein T439DRAFT_352010 [Meredithblackwellia eburnea MCA 4105]
MPLFSFLRSGQTSQDESAPFASTSRPAASSSKGSPTLERRKSLIRIPSKKKKNKAREASEVESNVVVAALKEANKSPAEQGEELDGLKIIVGSGNRVDDGSKRSRPTSVLPQRSASVDALPSTGLRAFFNTSRSNISTIYGGPIFKSSQTATSPVSTFKRKVSQPSYPIPQSRPSQDPPAHLPYLSAKGASSAPSLVIRPFESPRASPSPPASRWSPSSAGDASPETVPALPSFRNSWMTGLNSHATKPAFTKPISKRLSALHHQAPSPTPSRSPKGFGISGFRLGQQKKKPNIRKRGITVVNAQRIGSGRYTMMKEAAARASATRRESVAPAGDRRPSMAAGRRSSIAPEGMRRASLAPGGFRRQSVAAGRRPSLSVSGSERRASSDRRRSSASERRGSAADRRGSASSRATSRKESLARANDLADKEFPPIRFQNSFDAGSLITPPDSMYRPKVEEGPWVDLETPPPSPPMQPIQSKSTVHNRRSSSPSDLLSYVAASPELTCPDDSAALRSRQKQGRALSVVHVPQGHPANHHARFRSYNEKVADSQPLSHGSPKFGLVPPPRRGSVAPPGDRLPVFSRPFSPPDSLSLDGDSLPANPTMRKLSTFRLSIAEPRADDEEGLRRGSQASWATSFGPSSYGPSSPRQSSVRQSSVGSRRANSLVPPEDEGPRRSSDPATSAPSTGGRPSLSHKSSFPRSVTHRTSATQSLLSGQAEESKAAGKSKATTSTMSWAGYSLAGSSFTDRTSSIIEIAPDTVDSFPSPPPLPTLRRPNAPPPSLNISKANFVSPESSPNSLPPSESSAVSGSSFTSATTVEVPVRSTITTRMDRLSSTMGKLDSLESLFNVVQIELSAEDSASEALDDEKEEVVSPAMSKTPSTATFTMEDLLTPHADDHRWDSRSLSPAPSKSSSIPPPYNGSTPTLSSCTVEPTWSKARSVSPAPSVTPEATPRPKPDMHLDFSTFRLKPTDRDAQARPPSLVSPMTNPLTGGFFFNQDMDADSNTFQEPIVTPGTEIRDSFLGPVSLPTPEVEKALKNFDFTIPESPFDSTPSVYSPLTTPQVHQSPRGVARSTSTKVAQTAKITITSPVQEEMTPRAAAPGGGFEDFTWQPSFPSNMPSLTQGGKEEQEREKEKAGTPSSVVKRRETHPADSPQTKSKSHRWNKVVDSLEIPKEKEEREGKEKKRKHKERMIGPDVSVAAGAPRLGNPGKRGFDKVEIRDWLLTARRASAVSLSGGE